jgi:hypothetical protein
VHRPGHRLSRTPKRDGRFRSGLFYHCDPEFIRNRSAVTRHKFCARTNQTSQPLR